MTDAIHVLNGPNLNLLGKRQPELYGSDTLDDIGKRLSEIANAEGFAVVMGQSNYEGGLVEMIHKAREDAAALIINAGAYTHTSIAVHDALKMLDVPIIELHVSNIYARESFRHHSYISEVATAVMAGFGPKGYEIALRAALQMVRDRG